MLQAGLRVIVPGLVLAQKHYNRFSLFLCHTVQIKFSHFPSWDIELRISVHPETGREELDMGGWVYMINEYHLYINVEAEIGAAP